MISVSIINVTSYTGLELVRLLTNHPRFTITSVTGRSAVGKRLDEVFPQLHAVSGAPAPVIREDADPTELAFVCLPHAAAAEAVVSLLEHGTKVVDLSADFRLKDAGIYEEWYKHTHPVPTLLEQAVYGLCELHREAIQATSLVANPGCYATAAILGLTPALAHGLIGPEIIIDAKSGVSGAGRTPTLTTHYAEANEDISAYSLGGHRHLPEIVQECEQMARLGGIEQHTPLCVTFVPHLVPMTRGILATCYVSLKDGIAPEEVLSLYTQYYAGEPFVHVVDQPPHSKWSYGSNHCFIHPVVDRRTQRLMVISCLDNLIKGAAGQAVQNANLLFGLPETSGLTGVGVLP